MGSFLGATVTFEIESVVFPIPMEFWVLPPGGGAFKIGTTVLVVPEINTY